MAPLAQRRPVGEARLADLARLRREPALPLEERDAAPGARAPPRVPPSSTFCQSTPMSSAGSDSAMAAFGSAGASPPAASPACGSRCSVNQYDAYGPSVRKYGCSPMRGNSVSPLISTGISPANAVRSSSAGCTVRDRLATTRIVSRSSRRRKASTLRFGQPTNSSEPRPNTRCCLRIAISRFIQLQQRERDSAPAPRR